MNLYLVTCVVVMPKDIDGINKCFIKDIYVSENNEVKASKKAIEGLSKIERKLQSYYVANTKIIATTEPGTFPTLFIIGNI